MTPHPLMPRRKRLPKLSTTNRILSGLQGQLPAGYSVSNSMQFSGGHDNIDGDVSVIGSVCAAAAAAALTAYWLTVAAAVAHGLRQQLPSPPPLPASSPPGPLLSVQPACPPAGPQAAPHGRWSATLGLGAALLVPLALFGGVIEATRDAAAALSVSIGIDAAAVQTVASAHDPNPSPNLSPSASASPSPSP